MKKDNKQFRERFERWKRGELVYENGRPLPSFDDGKDAYRYYPDGQGGWFRAANDDMTRAFEGLVVTPNGTNKKFIPESLNNTELAIKARDKYNATHSPITGLPTNQGLEIVSPEFDIIGISPLVKAGAKMIGRLGNKAANIVPEVVRFYHGSPVRFDNFSADFIGSGEGGSKVMRGINLWPEEKITNAPKFANIKSPDAPLHLGASSTPLGGELNPTVYDVSGRGLKLYKTTSPREVKRLHQSDLISQGYDGIQTPNQVTVFPESIGKLFIDKQSTIEEFILAHPEVERWTPWTTDTKKMQNIIDMSKMSKRTPEQWTAAQDAAIARGDMAEAQRLRDLHFKVSAPNTKIVDTYGNPLHTYHGSNYINDATKKGDWSKNALPYATYFAPYRYANRNTPYYYKAYLNIKNPLASELDLTQEAIQDENIFKRFIKDKGYDGAISNEPQSLNAATAKEIVVTHPNQIKLADAVAYDDKGARIPLGERDNFSINDIRYGLLPFVGLGATSYELNNSRLK